MPTWNILYFRFHGNHFPSLLLVLLVFLLFLNTYWDNMQKMKISVKSFHNVWRTFLDWSLFIWRGFHSELLFIYKNQMVCMCDSINQERTGGFAWFFFFVRYSLRHVYNRESENFKGKLRKSWKTKMLFCIEIVTSQQRYRYHNFFLSTKLNSN